MNRDISAGIVQIARDYVTDAFRTSSPAKLRVLIALTVLLAMLVTSRSALAESQLSSSDAPLIVQVQITDPYAELDEQSPARDDLLDAVRTAIAHHHKAQPDRVLALRIRPGALRFENLSANQRERLSARHKSEAAHQYERALAELLQSIIADVRRNHPDAAISVYGLPIEGRAASVAQSNSRYQSVLDQCDVLVAARNLLTTSRDDDVMATSKKRLPATMGARNDRLMHFRLNGSWRTLGSSAAPNATMTDHTAQDTLLRRVRAVLEADPDLAEFLQQRGIDPDNLESARGNANQMDLLALLADWGATGSDWDLNSDGSVNVFDLLNLLSRWNEPDEPTTGIARFTALDNEYIVGSGARVAVELLADAPQGADVVFQTWSNVSQSIESPFHDTTTPFEYPTAALDSVTLGSAEIQALIRDASDQVILRLTAPVEFVSDPDDDGPVDDPPGDDDGGGPIDDPLPGPGDDDDDDGDFPPPGDGVDSLFEDLDQSVAAHLRDLDMPEQPQLDNPQRITVRTASDIPYPIPSNSVITVDGTIQLADANDGFVFNQGASDVLVQFEPGAHLRYTGGFTDRALFQFRTTASRIRIENAVISGPTGTRNTCHGFATMFGNGTCSDISIVGGEVSGVRFTFQGEGGCERLLITGVHAHDNWEYFVWGSNTMNNVTICHNIVNGVEVQHGIRLAPGVVGVNIVSNDIRVGQQGLIKRSIWIAGAYNVSILDNHTRDGRITIGPNPAFNEPGPFDVVLAGNRIDHDRNNLAIELFSGARLVRVSENTVTTPHSNWMQVGITDKFDRPFEDIRWTQDNIANNVQRHGYDGVRVSSAYIGDPDIGPID